jgi:X-Pro dipeptidyl-peptidase
VRDGELAKHQDRVSGDVNEFWQKRDYLNQLADWRTPMLMAHGFNDWNVMPEQSVELYLAIKKKGVPCIAYFHQHGHGGPPPRPLMHRWFTRFLFGVENGVDTKDPKAWIVREADRQSQPTQYPDYPHPDAAKVVLHPQGGGGKVGGLAPEAKQGAGVENIVDDPAQTGADLAKAAESEHRLLFATPALTAPLHLSGSARVTIKLACDKPATNLSVWLVSLPWTGERRITGDIITRGWADPQNAASLTKGVPLQPGKFVELAFDLQPDDQVIAAGEQIGLMIFASDPEFTLRPKAGTKLSIDLAGTSLSLPVVGGTAAFAAATGGSPAGQR